MLSTMQSDQDDAGVEQIDAPVHPYHRDKPPSISDDWALFLDVDGCLLELADAPDAVVVPAGLVDLLIDIDRRLDGAFALVSGRSLATLDGLFAPGKFSAAGLHGAEFRLRDGQNDSATVAPELAGLRETAERIAGVYPGAIVENKGAALALHWRQAPDAEPALQAFAANALTTLPGYRLQQGKQVVELRPGQRGGSDAEKGVAIAEFLDMSPFAGRLPVFAGDDVTDESGFVVVNAHAGVSVLVGDREPSAARHALRDPAAVRQWLGLQSS